MKTSGLPFEIQDKIYDTKIEENLQITTYFPLRQDEMILITKAFHDDKIIFKSIFSDFITESEWQKSRDQIKKKFQDELFKID